jgi:hypothetical protein
VSVGAVALPVLRCLGTGLVVYRAGWVMDWLCTVMVVYCAAVQPLLGTSVLGLKEAGYWDGCLLGGLDTTQAVYRYDWVLC